MLTVLPPTVAVFRPSSHEVFVFDRWTVDVPLSADPIAVVPGAVELVSARGRDGCPTLDLMTETGDRIPVELGGDAR